MKRWHMTHTAHTVVLFAGKFEPKKRPLRSGRKPSAASITSAVLVLVGKRGALESEPRHRAASPTCREGLILPFRTRAPCHASYALAESGRPCPLWEAAETWGLCIKTRP